MKFSRMIAALVAFVSLAFAFTAQARPAVPSVGTEQVSVPVAGAAAVPVTLWYPSTSTAQAKSFGPYRLEVAVAGDPVARRLPLIVMSHGTGGSAVDTVNLAVALAKAGFVVAAVEHPGDNYRDRSRSFTSANFAARSHQVTATIDFLTGSWRHKAVVDPARIGMFGHSAGGATTLIVGGGVLDFGQVVRFCIDNPEDWGCKGGRTLNPTATRADVGAPPVAAADPRVRALVVAAPALTHGFAPAGLARLKAPVQLWVGSKDAIVTNAAQVAALMPARPERHDVADAGHFSFLAPCPDTLRATAPQICTDPPGFDRAAFQEDFTRSIIRFFRAHLRR